MLSSLPLEFLDIYTEGEELASRHGWDTEPGTEVWEIKMIISKMIITF